MTDTKFTKGKWSTSYRKDSDGMYSQDVYDSNGKAICSCSWYQIDKGNGNTTTNREDNAHLIAAAPAMYKLLQKFLPMDEDGNGWDFQYNEGSEELGVEVVKLLELARGES